MGFINDIRSGKAPNLVSIKQAIGQMEQSTLRNPDAHVVMLSQKEGFLFFYPLYRLQRTSGSIRAPTRVARRRPNFGSINRGFGRTRVCGYRRAAVRGSNSIVSSKSPEGYTRYGWPRLP